MPVVTAMRALVTGGTSGIGAAIVERLRSQGADVVFTGRDRGRGLKVEERTGASFVHADVRDPEDVRASVDSATQRLGGLDALVLNAGVLHDAPLSETADSAWDAVLETNLVGPCLYAVACLPSLRASENASITAISSDAAVWGETSIGAYSVSKRALNMLVQTLAVEAGPAGVRVNAVCPGDTAPGMATRVEGRTENGDISEWALPPLARVGTGEDVAAAVVFFASPDGAFCNGSLLLLDGGMRASLRASAVATQAEGA
ncbi:MAG TPA: SDR family oxidoreductase [Gaiellaceae bacterium]